VARGRGLARDFGVSLIEREEGPVSCEIGGALWISPVLITAVPRRWVGPMLRAGVGPSPGAGMRCPVCAGELGSWGAYRRRVRVSRARFRLRVGRAHCRACERTHALLPGFLLAHRLDVVDSVGCALEMAADGRGTARSRSRWG